jgi:hypothetical protein
MSYELKELADRRFIGDSASMTVHDRWHPECEDCLMQTLVERGVAVGFEPDDLDQAFAEGYDYCIHCFDRSTPERPDFSEGS